MPYVAVIIKHIRVRIYENTYLVSVNFSLTCAMYSLLFIFMGTPFQ